jgi:hypothetical protein
VTNATSCNINVDIGTVPCADGSVVVTPTSTTEYMFSAVGAGGREWLYATVNVEAPVPLPVVTVTAVNDSYTMNEDATLTVPALSGVLTGDAASSGATLTAALGTGPAHGIVTLNPNGSFAYTPNADYSGSDSFTYRATDGQATSTPATVTITVTQLFDDSRTFQAVNGRQEFIVPPAVTSLQIEANGAQGGSSATTMNGGLGGSVRATVAVTPGETLFIFVGGHGRDRVPLDSGAGGFNGGGLGENGEFSFGGLGGGGGGGASDVRQGGMALANRIVIAGGGGGGGGNNIDGPGGNGGGLIGGAGQSVLVHPGSGGLVGAGGGGGAGGSQSSGGAGGTPQLCPAGADGALGTGGDGADCLNSGGGGGGGYYGGGGGGSAINFAAGAGGGGSSFTDPAAHSVTHVQGCCTGDGQIVLRW